MNVYFADEYGNFPAGIPEGHGVYHRIHASRITTVNGDETEFYDTKPGKGYFKNNKITRANADNQGLKSQEYMWVPCASEKEAYDSEDKYRKYCIEDHGWIKTNPKEYNIQSREHIHQKFSNLDQVKTNVMLCANTFFNKSAITAKTKLSYDIGLRKKIHDDLEKVFNCALLLGEKRHIPILDDAFRCILLNSFPGSGKSSLFLEKAKSLLKNDGDCAFVCSSIPDTLNSFIEDLQKYDDFKDINYCIVRGKDISSYKSADSNKWVILFTIQGIKTESEIEVDDIIEDDSKTIKTVLKVLEEKKLSVKIAAFDEFHFGTNTEKTKNSLTRLTKQINNFNDALIFALSATAEEYMEIFGFENSLIFNENDLNEARKNGDKSVPEVNIHVMEAAALCKEHPEVIRLLKNKERDPVYSRGDILSILPLFDSIIEPKPVQNLSSVVFDRKKLNTVNYGDKNGIVSMFVLINTINEAYELASSLDYYYKNKISVIKAFGGEKGSKLKPKDVIREIANNKKIGKHTIIISCGKFITGTNINNLSCLVLMKKCESSKMLRQFIGRLNREDKDIPHKYAFLLPSQKMIFQYSILESDYKKGIFNSNNEEDLKKVIYDRCLPLIDPENPIKEEENLLQTYLNIINGFKNSIFLNSNFEISSRKILEKIDTSSLEEIAKNLKKCSPVNYSAKDNFLTAETPFQELTNKLKKNKIKTVNANKQNNPEEINHLLMVIDKFLECLYCISLDYALCQTLPKDSTELKGDIEKSENIYKVFGFKFSDIEKLFSSFESNNIDPLNIIKNHIFNINNQNV